MLRRRPAATDLDGVAAARARGSGGVSSDRELRLGYAAGAASGGSVVAGSEGAGTAKAEAGRRSRGATVETVCGGWAAAMVAGLLHFSTSFSFLFLGSILFSGC